MSSTARYRSGPTNPIAVKCDPNFPIEVGDLLYQDPVSRLAKPASALANQGNPALNQEAFQEVFLGVALQRQRPAAQRSRAAEQHAQPQPGEHDRMRHQRRVRVRLRVESCQRLEHRRPGGAGEQHRRHGPADPGRHAGRSAYLAIGRAVPEAAAIGVANASVGVRIASTLMGQGVLPYYPISSSGVA